MAGHHHGRRPHLSEPQLTAERAPGHLDRPDRKVYALTLAGQQRVADWLSEVSWPKPDLTEFHPKLALPSRSPTVGFTWASAILSVGTAPSVSAAGLRSDLTFKYLP